MYKLHLFLDKQLPVLIESLMYLVPNNTSNEEKKDSSGDEKAALGNTLHGLHQVMNELSNSVIGRSSA